MIAKEVAMPRAGGSFRGLVTYLTGSRGKTERVGRVQLTNCVSTDVASAVLEVENTQACNRRARHGTYHLILSFPAGEEPAADVLEAIEHRACAALGFGEHQRVSVVHHDTDHLHVHVAINRVHPTTHRVHWPSYSKLVLDRLCVEFEQEFGLLPVRHRAREHAAQLEAANALRASLKGACAERLSQARTWAELHEAAAEHGVQVQLRGNGLALATCDGLSVRASSVSRDLSKAALERRLGPFEAFARMPGPPADEKPEPAKPVDPPEASGEMPGPVEHEKRDASARMPGLVGHENSKPAQRRAPDSERLGGIETLIGWIQRECAQSFRNARSWHELHEVAAAHGLRVKLRGNGLVFMTRDGITTKASSVARDLSKTALERRLGALEAAPTRPRAARVEYKPRPMERDERASRLYDRYRKEREASLEARARATAQLRQQRSRAEERLTRISKRRWAAVRLVAKGRVAWALWSAYARQADRRDRESVRNHLRAGVRTAVAQYPRTCWLEWLRNRAGHGDAEALATLRSRMTRERQMVVRTVSGNAPRGVFGDPVDSVTAMGTVVYAVPGGSIRDDGKRLHLSSRGASDAAAETLLRLAHARYGERLGVDGDDTFRARIVRVAAASRLPIAFVDPKLEQSRVELLNQENADGQRRAGETHRTRSTPATDTPRVGVGTSIGIRKSYAVRLRRGRAPQALADLRGLSSLLVVRFGRPSEVLLPADARRDLEQRRTEQPDRGVRRDSGERHVEALVPGRARGRRR